jgi:hypothetical protein
MALSPPTTHAGNCWSSQAMHAPTWAVSIAAMPWAMAPPTAAMSLAHVAFMVVAQIALDSGPFLGVEQPHGMARSQAQVAQGSQNALMSLLNCPAAPASLAMSPPVSLPPSLPLSLLLSPSASAELETELPAGAGLAPQAPIVDALAMRMTVRTYRLINKGMRIDSPAHR